MLNLKYIRYSRKSSEAKERQVASIQDQNSECENYALKEKLMVVKRLQESKSAFKPNIREIFNEMIYLIKAGKANAILTWKPDRLCRNPEEGGKILQMLQDGILKEIRTATGEIYTSDSDHLVLQIHFGMANQYSRNLSQNVKRGLKYKCERGEYPRRAFIGYRSFGEKGTRNIKPHLFEARLVKKAFEMAATGKHSLVGISKYLYRQGLVSSSGKRFSKAQMHRILTRPNYYGYFYHAGEFFKGNYEPIISKELFDVAQNGLKLRSKPKYTRNTDITYNGLIKCPECGCAVTTTTKIKYYKGTNRVVKYTYLHCTRRKGECSQPPINLDDFEKQIIQKIKDISIDKKVWSLGIRLLKEKNKEERIRDKKRLEKLHKELEIVRLKFNNLIDMRANEELSKKEFFIQKELYLREQARIDGLIKDLRDSSDNWLELAEAFLNTAFYARKIMQSNNMEKKRNLIMCVGENLFLEDKKLDFRFKKPFDILLKPQYRTSGRG